MSVPNFHPNNLPSHATAWYREGRYFTPPHEEIIAAFLTIVAKFSNRYDVGIAAWAMMGSHPHMLVFDRHREPDEPSLVWLFRQQVHACFAKWLNSFWGRRGAVFSYSVVSQMIPIVDTARTVTTVGYIENNPVAARFVNSPDEMPIGSVSLREMLDSPLVVPRPKAWFRKNKWPDFAVVKVEMPPSAVADGFTDATWSVATRKEVLRRNLETLMTDTVSPALGVEALLQEGPFEPRKERVSYAPAKFSGTDRARLAKLYEKRRRQRSLYRHAMRRVRRGDRDVEFPWGTARMVVSHGFPMMPG